MNASAHPLPTERSRPQNLRALPPFPDGWYAVALASELGVGKVLSTTFAGSEVLLFRTRSGEAVAVGAFCPHLGAHMGHGGTVCDDTIVCPFHAFRFDKTGACVATGYGTKAPPRARIPVWPVAEINGLILLWHHHAGVEPDWCPPTLDWAGWTALRCEELSLRSHPQETTENSVDVGHLTVVHGYSAVDVLDPISIDGPYLTSEYTMTRSNPWSQRLAPIVNSFRVHVWGLGYSLVDIHTRNFDFHFRLFILPTPIDGERIKLRVALSAREDCRPAMISPVLSWIPSKLFAPLLLRQTLEGVVADVRQDFAMWEHKVYVDPPILAKGDGPIGVYRRYCRQFYPPVEAPPHAADPSG